MNLNGQQLLNNIQNQFLKSNLPKIKIGDNVKIGVKIIEGNKETTTIKPIIGNRYLSNCSAGKDFPKKKPNKVIPNVHRKPPNKLYDIKDR